jgi:hypothetical protein
MPKYNKKIQMLITENQYRELEKIASTEHKKLGTLVREAVVEYHLKSATIAIIKTETCHSSPNIPIANNFQGRPASQSQAGATIIC